jgi:hypothetical protein
MRHRFRRLAPPLAAATLAGLVIASTAGANHDGIVRSAGHVNVCADNNTACVIAYHTGTAPALSATAETGAALSAIHSGAAGSTAAVHADTYSNANGAAAVRGQALGVPGAAGSAGVAGTNVSTDAGTWGVVGAHTGSGIGVYGVHTATSGDQAGVLGVTNSTDTLATGTYGEAPGDGPLVTGVYGGATHGIGLLGFGGNIALAAVNPTGGLAGYFGGDVYVNGTLGKAAGGFRIDHPLEPETQYLQHSFVESPDMKNVYDGVVTTDRRGYATVRLPRYFAALNRSFRYQLTSLSGLQNVAVAREIARNRFVVQSEKPRSRVSWQVTGIRKDRYANANRIRPEVAKGAARPSSTLDRRLRSALLSRQISRLREGRAR